MVKIILGPYRQKERIVEILFGEQLMKLPFPKYKILMDIKASSQENYYKEIRIRVEKLFNNG